MFTVQILFVDVFVVILFLKSLNFQYSPLNNVEIMKKERRKKEKRKTVYQQRN